MKKLILTLLVFVCVTLTDCTNYSNFNADKLGDSCIIASRRYISPNDPNKINTTVYCIDGVQYIKTHGGISPYIDYKAVNNYFENGFKACSCRDEK